VKKEIGKQDFVLGSALDAFEDEWAKFCGSKAAIGVGSGLSALELALQAAGVGRGDEVLVPSNTFIATWMAVSNIGATPVPVPTSRDDYNLIPELLSSRVSPKTKAIVPVHLYGYPAELKRINEVALTHNLKVIEDAAQAHGAEYRGDRIGAHSDAVAWSFYPGKNLGAFGDGGAVTTNSAELADKVRLLRNYGSIKKYRHESIGTNSRLDSLQCAILSVKLKYLSAFNARREAIASLYLQRLGHLAERMEHFSLPPASSPNRVSSWHLFVIRVPDRDRVQNFLELRGIETAVHYPIPPGNQAAYSTIYSSTVDDESSSDADSLLSLPIGPHLSGSQAHRVCETLEEFYLGANTA